jgi:hypothetical protein
MKNVFLFLVLFFCVSIGYSQQYPVNQTLGAPTTLVTSRGGFKADSSFILPAYSDTNKANANPYVKNYAGSLIKVGNTIYMRSSNLSQWILVGSGGGSTPNLQQVLDVGFTAYNKNLTLIDSGNGFASRSTIAFDLQRFGADNYMTINDVLGYRIAKYSNQYARISSLASGGGNGKSIQIGWENPSDNFMSLSFANSDFTGAHKLKSGSGFGLVITTTIPPVTGTLAMSVNNQTADANGNITIAGGSGTITSISQGYGITNSTNPIVNTGTVSVDTATLSNKYLRIVDTTNKFVNRITRTSGKDSIIYFVGGTRLAIKDSVGNTSGFIPYTGATQDVNLGNFKISAQSFQVEGTNGLGHIHFKHQNSDATATGQSTVLYANSNGDLKYKNAGNYYSTLKTQQTADRIYTFQNKSYTLADSSEVVNLTTAQTIAGQKTFSSNIKMPTTGSDLILQILSDGTIASMASATYPTPTELTYVKGVTSAIQTQINNKVNISDTASMLSPYAKSNLVATKLNASDTISLSTRIETKLTNLDLLQSLSLGIKAEPYGISLANVTSQLALTTTRLCFYPFNWNVSDSIRGIAFLNRSATTLTATNYNGIAIYSLSGGTLTRLTFTSNNSTFWDNASINTWKTQAITPFYLTKGVYYLGYQVSGSAGTPTIASGTIMQIGLIEPPSAVNSNGIKISSFVLNATTSPPSSVAFSTTTTLQQVPYFILY